MNTYSALEASVKLNISKRAVQKRCKKDNIRKKDNKYLITDLVIDGWAKEIESSVPTNVPSNIGTQELVFLMFFCTFRVPLLGGSFKVRYFYQKIFIYEYLFTTGGINKTQYF